MNPEEIRMNPKEKKIGGVIFNPYFWECDCSENFVRSKAHQAYCNSCGANMNECPDAMENDVNMSIKKISENWDNANV